MRGKFIVIGLGVGVLTLSSLTLYYRGQADYYHRQYEATLSQLGQLMEFRDEPELTMPFIPQAEVRPIPKGLPAEATLATGIAETAVGRVDPINPSPSRGGRRSPEGTDVRRTNDSARAADFQQRRLEIQQRMQTAWSQSTNYFMSRDTSRMPEAELEEYTTMINLLNQAAALRQQLQGGLPPEVRHTVAAALRSNIVAVTPLLENERNREYYDAAIAMGQSEQDAATLVSYINQIASNTSIRTIFPGMRMGGGHGH